MKSTENFLKPPNAEEFWRQLRSELYQAQRPANEVFLDETGLCDYLKISKRHAANLRSERQLTYYKPGGKLYYKLSDVIAFIEKNEIKAISEMRKIHPF